MSDTKNIMAFEDIVNQRYATKVFDGRKIEQEKIKKLLDMIRHAPSSYNVQPWKIVVIEDESVKEKLSEATYNQPQIKSSSHVLVFCVVKDLFSHIDRLEQLMIRKGTDKTKAKSYTDTIRDFGKELTQEEKISWTQRQTYLALGNALNGAKSLGFDSCPMEGFDPDRYSQILNLPENLIPIVVCAIGYALDKPKQKIRFPEEEIFLPIKYSPTKIKSEGG